MKRKVIKIGSSAGITIPKEELKRQGLKVGDEVQITTDSNGNLVVASPKSQVRRDRIAKLTLDFAKRYRKDLEQLADE